MLQIPSAGMLNTVAPTTDVDPSYLDASGVDPRIAQLTARITGRSGTQFGKVVALNKYFLDPANGFRYSLKTAAGSSGDALVDFLLRNKVGYCEQFASSMAVMLRTIGVPARVAVGFTPGKDDNGVRSIWTGDAHAWVEAYFAGAGWLTFDPTPLGDGRGITPTYVAQVPGFPSATPPPTSQSPPADGQDDQAQGATPQPSPQQSGGTPLPSPASPGQAQGGTPGTQGAQPGNDSGSGGGGSAGDKKDDASSDGQTRDGSGPGGLLRAALIGLLTALVVMAVIAAPSTARRLVRRKRLAVASEGGVDGAAAAWRELLAESRDRGGKPPGNRTVRSAARLLVINHRLDPVSSSAVRAVVSAVERGWYAPPSEAPTGAQLVAALRQIRTGLDQAAPLSILDRLWPRSVRPQLSALSGYSGDGHDQAEPPVAPAPADRYAATASRR
jgi:hypothetical protein